MNFTISTGVESLENRNVFEIQIFIQFDFVYYKKKDAEHQQKQQQRPQNIENCKQICDDGEILHSKKNKKPNRLGTSVAFAMPKVEPEGGKVRTAEVEKEKQKRKSALGDSLLSVKYLEVSEQNMRNIDE